MTEFEIIYESRRDLKMNKKINILTAGEKMVKPKSARAKSDLNIIPGDTRILLIAPHGVSVPGKKKDDINTDELTEKIANRINCSAIINNLIKRNKLDLNIISQAERHPKFIKAISNIAGKDGHTLVVWIHGAADGSVKREARNKTSNFTGKPDELHALIGYGQGPNPKIPATKRKGEDRKSKLTATKKTAEKLKGLLTHNGLATILTRDNAPNFRGRNPDNMNQWFLKKGYDLSTVQSLQLEIRHDGFRGIDEIDKTAKIIATALSELIDLKSQDEQSASSSENLPTIAKTETEDPLVVEAFERLKEIFQQHFHKAMLEAGKYLIDKFYGNIEDARNNKKPLLPLIKKLQANSGNVPSKTWVYDAVKLAIDEHDFKDFRTYGNLGHSQKVLLTHVDSDQQKRELVEEAVEGNYTVAKLRERIRDIKGKNPLLSYSQLPKIDELKKLEPPQLVDLKEATQNRINKLYDELNLYQKRLEKISSVLNQTDMAKETDQKAKRGFRDWTEPANNINFCTGCENDCIYCYAKSMSYRFGQVKKGHWHEMVIRQNDVDKKRKLHNGIIGFPSSHDILPTNIDAYLIVLGKLLRAGNEVLIVSKPRLDCINRICGAAQFFKDKILFRFTIGAMNNDILSYWEPNAPTYDERKKCLQYAFHWGFRTSISMEPMLETKNIEALVEDLLPFVSEDIWLGTMNHISRIKKGADKRLLSELEIIEAGQTPEKLLAIDKIFRK